MKKIIFFDMILLTVLCVIVAASAFSFVFYQRISQIVKSELFERADIFRDNTSDTTMEALSDYNNSEIRFSIINPDGKVIFDTLFDPEKLENHADRKEILEASEKGFGESKRFSNTFHEETNYYAVKLADDYFLRVAKTSRSIFSMFGDFVPTAFCVVLALSVIVYFLAGRLTNYILKPINQVDLNSEIIMPYDELKPFVKTILEQRKYIELQMSELQERADTIAAIMDNMNEGIVIVEKNGNLLSVNKSALSFFDIKLPVKGKNILEIFRNADFNEKLCAALDGSCSETDIEVYEKTLRANFSPVSGSGVIIFFRDITENISSENMRKEFSANVSHELKTPLTTIYGNAEMLFNEMVKNGDEKLFYKRIKTEAERMIRLIDDIILISKLDEDVGGELFEELELSEIIAETIDSLSQKAEKNNISINSSCEKINIKANRSQMYELFYNLIDNAIKYNKPSGTVDINLKNLNSEIKFVIKDSGIGIPKESQSRVFERFYRVDKSRSKNSGGTGLGLAIVKHIVKAHGGKIELVSEENCGTEISVIFNK